MGQKGISITDHAESWHVDRGLPLAPKYTDDDDGIIEAEGVSEESEEIDDIEGTETICDLSMAQQIKFKVNMDNIRLFCDDELKKEVFTCELKKDEIVSGRFVATDVVELAPELF